MKVSILTACLLIVLRVAIGWHLFYEGAWKEQHKETWSSQGFLRAAKGPGALPSRWMAGDPTVTRNGWTFDELHPDPPPDPTTELLARFTVAPIPHERHGKIETYHQYVPGPLKKEWTDYAQRFFDYYKLDDAARKRVDTLVTKHENETVRWLLEGDKKVPKQSSATGTIEVTKKTPERVREYLAKVNEVHEIRDKYVPAVSDGAKAKLDKAVAEEKAQRANLLADLNERTEKMNADLRGLLTYEQRRIAPMPDVDVKAVEQPKEWERLEQLNSAVRWGLLAVGIGLMIGLFTRFACLGGVLLLVAFYLPAPPAPLGLADSQAREHFFAVNWNVIEALALLTLATTRTGRWFGVDGLLQFLLPWRRRQRPATTYIRPPHSDRLRRVATLPVGGERGYPREF
jgi:uncharacterized membrane protein YphA (DoxX/SURF4 family)